MRDLFPFTEALFSDKCLVVSATAEDLPLQLSLFLMAFPSPSFSNHTITLSDREGCTSIFTGDSGVLL